MAEWLGTSLSVFVLMTVILMGGAGFMTGQALAAAWRPVWQLFLYSLLLGGADRFLSFALFQAELLSLSGYLLDTAVIAAIAGIAFRLTRARRMVSQYPWLYERSGPFSWRERRS